MSYLATLSDGSVLIRLHVQPGASKSKIVGLHGGCLKIAVAAPPVDGKATKEVVKVVADVLGVSARDVILKSGALSRKKQLVVKVLDAAQIRTVIEKRLIPTNGK